jgi:hypothetical protein
LDITNGWFDMAAATDLRSVIATRPPRIGRSAEKMGKGRKYAFNIACVVGFSERGTTGQVAVPTGGCKLAFSFVHFLFVLA